MATQDRAWLEGALGTWREAEVEWLKLAPQALPTVAAIDAQCTYLLPVGHFEGTQAMPHGEIVTMPDGAEAPIGPISFASGCDRRMVAGFRRPKRSQRFVAGGWLVEPGRRTGAYAGGRSVAARVAGTRLPRSRLASGTVARGRS
jgi:hypothetical protein